MEKFKKGDEVKVKVSDYTTNAVVIGVTDRPDGRQRVRLRSERLPNFFDPQLRHCDSRINETGRAYEYFFPTKFITKK